MNNETNRQGLIQSVSRAIQILKLYEVNEELGVTEISKAMGLHKSTTFGLISTLEAHQFLEKNHNTDKYRLGLEVFRLGTKVNTNLRKVTHPFLLQMVRLYNETVNLVTLEDLSVTYVEKVESPHSMRISTVVGGNQPLYCTAVGKALLAFLPAEEREDRLTRMTFKRFTKNTICDTDTLHKYLIKVQERGYAQESEELETGLCCVAAPIFNHMNIPYAAISVSGPVHRMNLKRLAEIGVTLVEITREISKGMGADLSRTSFTHTKATCD